MKLRIAGGKTAETESKGFVTAYKKGIEARKESEEMECPYGNDVHGGYHAKFWYYGWHYQDERMMRPKKVIRVVMALKSNSVTKDGIDWSKVPVEHGVSIHSIAAERRINKFKKGMAAKS